MYKLLLCWRYLLTRYLALACIISVMLGVATLIVVNSVMSGFSTKLRERLHGFLSDVVVESVTFDGMFEVEAQMERIRKDAFLHDRIELMSPTMETFALLQLKINGETIPRYVKVAGIDPKTRAAMGGFSEFLLFQKNSKNPSFEMSPEVRQAYEQRQRLLAFPVPAIDPALRLGDKPNPDPPPEEAFVPDGIVLGYAIAHYRDPLTKKEIRTVDPGDEVVLITLGSGNKNPIVNARLVVVDYVKSEMSDADSSVVYVSLDVLQRLRTMDHRASGIQIKLKDYQDAEPVTDRLKELFPYSLFHVATWEQKQGALLAAINIEKGILNVLLFLIIGVAGFGILAIFAMIVVEKTRDIGILKSLGASNGGVMKIFLGYGALLGTVGAVLGSGLGLFITEKINEIEGLIGQLTGKKVFDPGVYYFDKIPTDIQISTVVLVNAGAITIAVAFSVIPALRAAMLHPVKALRYE